MISIRIWGMPKLPEETLVALAEEIRRELKPVVNDPRNHNPNASTISVQYPVEMMQEGIGTDISVEVSGCNDYLASNYEDTFRSLISKIRASVSNCKHVECRINRTNNDVVFSG